jgi:hypothetical protein
VVYRLALLCAQAALHNTGAALAPLQLSMELSGGTTALVYDPRPGTPCCDQYWCQQARHLLKKMKYGHQARFPKVM